MLGHQRLDRGDRSLGGRVAGGQPGVDAVLDPAQPELAQPLRFDRERRHVVAEIFEWMSPPRFQCLVDLARCRYRIGRQETPGVGERLAESFGVELVTGFEHEHVAAAAADEPVLSQSASEMGDVRVQRSHRPVRGRLAPELLDQTVRGDHFPG